MKKLAKRSTRKQKDFIQTLSFFAITISSIVGLIAYLWVYTEIDETLIAIELQKATREELNNSIKDLQNDIKILRNRGNSGDDKKIKTIQSEIKRLKNK